MKRYGVTSEEAVKMLTKADLLTERQAEAYVYCEANPTPRRAVADRLGISTNVLDSHLAAARKKVTTAEATVEALDQIQRPDVPNRCTECGSPLGGQWSENNTGEPICFECAGIDFN